MRYLITHETLLSFPKPVREHQCELRLVPREDDRQRVLDARITVIPESHLGGYVDCFGNRVTTTSLVPPHDKLRVTLDATIETKLENPFAYAPIDTGSEAEWTTTELRREPRLLDFVVHSSASVPSLGSLPDGLSLPKRSPKQNALETMQALMVWAHETFRYEAGATVVHEPLLAFLEKRAGVCQDFAHLLVAAARSHGFPARYAMGYLDPVYLEEDEDEADEADVKAEAKEKATPAKPPSQSQSQSQSSGKPVPPAVAADPASAPAAPAAAEEPSASTHAWAEVLIPGAGWRGFDATQDLVVNDTYVTVAVGRDSRDAAPLRGSFKGDDGGERPRVRLRVARQQQQ